MIAVAEEIKGNCLSTEASLFARICETCAVETVAESKALVVCGGEAEKAPKHF